MIQWDRTADIEKSRAAPARNSVYTMKRIRSSGRERRRGEKSLSYSQFYQFYLWGGSEDTPTAFSAVPSRFLRYTAAPLYRNLFPAKSYIKRARYRRERKREKGERDGGREPQGERISVEHRAESSSKLARLSYIYLLILSSLIPLSLSRNLSLSRCFFSLSTRYICERRIRRPCILCSRCAAHVLFFYNFAPAACPHSVCVCDCLSSSFVG